MRLSIDKLKRLNGEFRRTNEVKEFVNIFFTRVIACSYGSYGRVWQGGQSTGNLRNSQVLSKVREAFSLVDFGLIIYNSFTDMILFFRVNFQQRNKEEGEDN